MNFAKQTLLKNSQIKNNFIERETLLEKRGFIDPEAFTRRSASAECYDYLNQPMPKAHRFILVAVISGGLSVWVLALHFLGAF